MINKLKNLVGGNSNGFYLEADEADNSDSNGAKVEKATTTEVTAPVEEKAAEPVAAATEAAETVPVQSTKKSKKTSIKDKKKKATGTTTAPVSKATPASSNGASSYEEPFWVKAMYKNNGSSNGKTEGGEKTFATDNLLPTPSNYRRRPGPSLNKFKDMARQARIKRR